MSGQVALTLALRESAWETGLVRALTKTMANLHSPSPRGEAPRAAVGFRRCVDVTDLLAVAGAQGAGVVVVDAGFPKVSADVIGRLGAAGCRVVAVCEDEASEGQLRQLGVHDVLLINPLDPAPAATAIREIVVGCRASAGKSTRGTPGPADTCPDGSVTETGSDSDCPQVDGGQVGMVVAVWGPPGAPGRTSIALGLAHAASRRGVSTLVVDADTRAPGVASMLGLSPDWCGLVAAAGLADRGALTTFSLARQARQLGPSWRVLTGIGSPEAWTDLVPSAMPTVIDCASRLDELVVVDVGSELNRDDEILFDQLVPRRDAAALAAVAAADLVIAVGSCEPPALARLLSALPRLSQITDAPVQPLINRVRRSLKGFGDPDRLVELLDVSALPKPWFVPMESSVFDNALCQHRLPGEVSPNSAFSVAVACVADRVLDAPRRPPRLPRSLLQPVPLAV